MRPQAFDFADLRSALGAGWRLARATGGVSAAYAALFAVAGGLIVGGLLAAGHLPFVIVAAGGFLLLGPVLLAGFFGVAAAHEAGRPAGWRAIGQGFAAASPALWALALVCGLLFMIFVTDAAILYAYLVGGAPPGLAGAGAAPVGRFVRWAVLSGALIATLLYAVSAFAVPLLCERRADLAAAVAASVRAVFSHWPAAFSWAFFVSTVLMASALLPPALPLTLPWLAYASRDLYRRVFPLSAV